MLRKLCAVFLAAIFWMVSLPVTAAGYTPDAKGVVVIEMETGRILFDQHGERELPMASTTKIMTALITLEQPGLDEYFTVDSKAIQVEGSSMGLQEGDQVTLRTLAYGMLLASGNDAAGAAAVRIAGSEEAFVQMMNDRAQEIGLSHTHFATPSGLDGEGHYSSAYDMAILAKNALENPDFAEICGTYRAQVEFGNPPYTRWMKNHNRLLDEYEGTIGVKTGFTKEAGRCLVSAVQRDGVGLICVTLGASDDWNVHKNLYNQFFERVQSRQLDGSLSCTALPVVGGERDAVSIALTETPKAGLSESELSRVERRVELSPFLYAPVEAGDMVGSMVYTLDGAQVCRVPIAAKNAVAAVQPEKKPGFFQTLWNWLTDR